MRGSFRAIRRSAAATVPAVLLGLAAGATGGIWAANALDTTPYDATDFNTASRDARLAGKSEGWKAAAEVSARAAARLQQANNEKVKGLEATIAALRKTVGKQKTALIKADKEAEKQAAKATKVQRSLAETTAALGNATGQLGDGHAVEGVLKVRQVLTRKRSQQLPSCADSLQTYQVRVQAGADVTVATARLVKAEAVSTPQGGPQADSKRGRARDNGPQPKVETVTMTCSLRYTVNLPTPLGSSYRFVAVQPAKSDAALASKPATRAALEDGNGPTLAVTH